jgi:hypothetical protein
MAWSFFMQRFRFISSLLLIGGLSINYVYADSTTLHSLTDREMSETRGQALMSLSYISPNDITNMETHRSGGDANIGFYRLGVEAKVEINANIKKLQLGCGGINGANGCDIDIDNFSLSGASTATQDTAANRAARVQSDAVMNNPFIEFAVKNPDSASTRSIEGFRLSAESVMGMLTFGSENSQTSSGVGIPNGINSLSGYMELNSASGTAVTNARNMTQAIGNMTGRVEMCVGLKIGNTCVGGWAPVNYTASTYNIELSSASANFTTDPAVVNGKRQTAVQLTGKANIGDITFKCPTGQETSCVTATALGLPLKEGVSGTISNLKANVFVDQSLGLIHKIPVNGNAFSLSLQSKNIQWPGAAVANIAQQGWWLAFGGGIDIGNISPSNNVDIPDSSLRQALGPAGDTGNTTINGALYNNMPRCSLTGCLFGTVLQVPKIYLGPGNGAPVGTPQTYVDFPLVNQVLSAQSFVPNCYGGLKFC